MTTDQDSEFFIEKPITGNSERICRGPIFIGSCFSKVIRKFGKNSASRNQKTDGFELQSVWSGIVGDNVGDVSFPVKITPSGILNISITNSAIASIISHSSVDIIQKVNGFFGMEIVKKIKITEVQN